MAAETKDNLIYFYRTSGLDTKTCCALLRSQWGIMSFFNCIRKCLAWHESHTHAHTGEGRAFLHLRCDMETWQRNVSLSHPVPSGRKWSHQSQQTHQLSFFFFSQWRGGTMLNSHGTYLNVTGWTRTQACLQGLQFTHEKNEIPWAILSSYYLCFITTRQAKPCRVKLHSAPSNEARHQVLTSELVRLQATEHESSKSDDSPGESQKTAQGIRMSSLWNRFGRRELVCLSRRTDSNEAKTMTGSRYCWACITITGCDSLGLQLIRFLHWTWSCI